MGAIKTSPKATENNRYAGLFVKRNRRRIIVGREDKSALNNMHCQVRLKPFTRGSAIFIALLALWDILRIIKENKEKGPGEEE